MNFTSEYFEDEVRCGYPVPTMIKRGWAAGLEVLAEVDRICQEEGITYYADWGTCLGAVRHKGYIPWDDDIDLCMKRPDYEKFLKAAKTKLPEEYTVHNIYTDDKFTPTLTCVMNCQSGYNITPEFMEKYHGCPAQIGLDIIALDYLPRKKKDWEETLEALNFLISLIAQYDSLDDAEKKKQLKLVETALGTKIKTDGKSGTVTYQLGLLLENICKLYSEKDADELCNMVCMERGSVFNFPKAWFDRPVMMDFETTRVPLPTNYEGYLHVLYGDYMQLVKNGSTHEYPYFGNNYKAGYAALGATDYCPTSMPMPREEKPAGNSQKPLYIFMVAQAKHWDEMKNVYEKNAGVNAADVYVMPVPYYVKDCYGNALELKYEGNDFPADLPLVDYNDNPLKELHPERIYFQTPWDEWNDVIQLPEEYCSPTLMECTDQLIYVPINQPVVSEDARTQLMIRKSIEFPGVLNADRIEIENNDLRVMYLKALTDYTGEGTKAVWMKKLQMN